MYRFSGISKRYAANLRLNVIGAQDAFWWGRTYAMAGRIS